MPRKGDGVGAGARVLGGEADPLSTLRELLGQDYASELADLDAAAGVCAEVLAVLRASVAGIEDRLRRNVALRTDTLETEAAAARRVVKTTPAAALLHRPAGARRAAPQSHAP